MLEILFKLFSSLFLSSLTIFIAKRDTIDIRITLDAVFLNPDSLSVKILISA
jgi:hypothetical protein